jgi:hypothetical protein
MHLDYLSPWPRCSLVRGIWMVKWGTFGLSFDVGKELFHAAPEPAVAGNPMCVNMT